MDSRSTCPVCGGFTNPNRIVSVAEIVIGISRKCEGCRVLSAALAKFPEYEQKTAFLFWQLNRTIFISLLDHQKQLLTAMELFVDPGRSCILPLVGPARIVSKNAWDVNTIKLTKFWVDNCVHEHSICPKNDQTPLPTRVIDVGQNDNEVHLYTSKGENARYAALSHCWGGIKPIQTHSLTLKSHIERILFDPDSKTFADAIRVTRDLGIRYIWIDSLCIVQDDREDWAREAGKMSQVYRNAAVTLSAEAAKSATDGLFTSPTRRAELQVGHQIESKTVDGQPLTIHLRLRDMSCMRTQKICHASVAQPETAITKRAWIVQERLLSTRILHFYEEELAWSCCSVSRCECKFDAGHAEPSVFKTINDSAVVKLKTEYNLQREWAGLVTNFSAKKLTYPTDRLPALAGLAGLVQENTRSKYFAGLWEFDIPYGLLWMSDHEKMRPNRIQRFDPSITIPSWSWASVIGPVLYFERHRTQFEHRTRKAEVKPLLQYIDASTTSKGPNQFGHVVTGSVIVKGQLLAVKYDPSRDIWRPRRESRPPEFESSIYDNIFSHGALEVFEQLSMSSYPEPKHEPNIIFDVLEEHPATTSNDELKRAQYYFLRAGICITSGMFSSHARENVCLLLRRKPLEPLSFQTISTFKRAGIVLQGFHTMDVWQNEPIQEVQLV